MKKSRRFGRPHILSICILLSLGHISIVGHAQAQSMELNIDRPGSDYRNFDLPRALPNLCHDACEADERCQAWTYVKPGVQGPNARCWLKHRVPEPRAHDCCISGVRLVKVEEPKVEPTRQRRERLRPARDGELEVEPKTSPKPRMEFNVDRPGSDYRSLHLPEPDPLLCFKACEEEERCKAWTYVQPTRPGQDARCFLKHRVPDPRANSRTTSGVKVEQEPEPEPEPEPQMEFNTDRPGSDYRSFDLPQADPLTCQQTCDEEERCKAWTYVEPGRQGRNARCWLKHRVPDPRPSEGCISGVK